MTKPAIGRSSRGGKPMGGLRWWLLGAGALALAALVVVGALPPRAQAAKIDVTTTADELNADGDCSLREAIEAANTDTAVDACTAGSGADVINLPAGNYKLTIGGTDEDANATGDLDIREDLTINGEDEATTIIDGNASDRVFEVLGATTVEITDVTVRNGSTEVLFGGGGGIRNDGGTLTLTNSTVSGNTGGGIENAGGGFFGGGGGTVTLTNSTVSGNTAHGGGGIDNGGGTLTLTNSTVSGNTATLGGGGISNGGLFGGGTLTLTNSTVSGNESTDGFGGGIDNGFGTLTLTNSTVSGNTAPSGGGGIDNFLGTLTLTNSTVSGNTAADGGGIFNLGGGATLTNSTVSGNTAGGDGGGISNLGGMLTLTNSTVSGNTAGGDGGGIFNLGGTLTLKNTIVADNGDENCGGADPVTSLGNNLEDDDTCGLDPLATKADLINTDPLLGPLADNGGPTETHALLAGSPAIDAGHDGACPATDQRGVARPQGAACDIGAYESGEIGDVDKDGDVDIFDGVAILAAIAGFEPLEFPDNGDVNGDGTTNIFDVLAVLGIVAGL